MMFWFVDWRGGEEIEQRKKKKKKRFRKASHQAPEGGVGNTESRVGRVIPRQVAAQFSRGASGQTDSALIRGPRYGPVSKVPYRYPGTVG